MFKVIVDRSFPGGGKSATTTNEFTSPLNFSTWLGESTDFYFMAVKYGEFTEVIISVFVGEHRHEIHIEKIRGKVRISEFDVSDASFTETADEWEHVNV